MLHISFKDNTTSDIVDCILLIAPRFAALSTHSLKVSLQCEGIQQKVTRVPFIRKQLIKSINSATNSAVNIDLPFPSRNFF